uniref:Uncharacterized protein n=1 Tax=Panagrolaimus sp. PS1159 TaxID=55785 RepID=A0AC35FMB7_9BILA
MTIFFPLFNDDNVEDDEDVHDYEGDGGVD